MVLFFPSQLSIGIAPQPELNIDGFGYKTSAILAPSELPLGITSSSNLLLNLFRTPSQPRPIEMALISILFLAAFVPTLQGVSLQGVTPDTPMQALVFDKLDELENRIDIDELELELKEIRLHKLEIKLSRSGAFCGYV